MSKKQDKSSLNMRRKFMYISLAIALVFHIPMFLVIRNVGELFRVFLDGLIQAVIWWIILQIGYVIYSGVRKLL